MPVTITITTSDEERQWQSKRKFESHLDHGAIEDAVNGLIDTELDRKARLFDEQPPDVLEDAPELIDA